MDETMVQGSKTPGRDVPVTRDTSTPDTPGDYHNYEGSQAKMYDTYSNRMEALSEALGNKDSAKG